MANDLIDVRERLVRRSGHHELVTDFAAGTMTLATDSPADQFINTAQRNLDSKVETPGTFKWFMNELAIDEISVTIPDVKWIKEVWVADATEGRTRLERKELGDLRTLFGDDKTLLTKARPTHWAIGPTSVHPEATIDVFAEDDDEIIYAAAVGYHDQTILFYPPADKVYTMRVLLQAYTNVLAVDADTSWWTLNHIDVLVESAHLELEKHFHRNQEGINLWEASLAQRVREIYNDMIALEANSWHPDELVMEG